MYKVTEYIGDYPVENQTFWSEEFKTVKAANYVARALYYYPEELTERDVEYHVLVEKYTTKGALGVALIGYTSSGPLTNEALNVFLGLFKF